MVCLTCFGMACQYQQNAKTDSHLSIRIGLSPAFRGLSQAVMGKPSEVLVNISDLRRHRRIIVIIGQVNRSWEIDHDHVDRSIFRLSFHRSKTSLQSKSQF